MSDDNGRTHYESHFEKCERIAKELIGKAGLTGEERILVEGRAMINPPVKYEDLAEITGFRRRETAARRTIKAMLKIHDAVETEEQRVAITWMRDRAYTRNAPMITPRSSLDRLLYMVA